MEQTLSAPVWSTSLSRSTSVPRPPQANNHSSTNVSLFRHPKFLEGRGYRGAQGTAQPPRRIDVDVEETGVLAPSQFARGLDSLPRHFSMVF